ncbi:RagB/SusD family nutrient uptake outer membrane protein [Persicobacter psychrovividus]|uniref:Outer membrane protein n=1 Tax=Persicobacter psychrovividus TaxID=387638 RepID=A0ABM7VBJ8_9BACT|nr:outer membrane protein [Persicobacter psychrovividus]
MKLNRFNNILTAITLLIALTFTSCVGDLNVKPIDPNLDTADKVYQNEADLQQGLAKIYAGLAVTGQRGPAGDGDIDGIDEGASSYWRGYWMLQELPTDEAVNGWGDPGIPSLNRSNWTASNSMVTAMYYRIMFQVTLSNEFIRQSKALMQPDWKEAPKYIAQARALRAFAYYNGLELYGNIIPKVTEEDGVGAFLPPSWGQLGGDELFNYLKGELEDIIAGNDLAETGMIGEVTKDVARTLLAKMLLNHEVILGSKNNAYYAEAETLLEKVAANHALNTEKGINANDLKDEDGNPIKVNNGQDFTPYQVLFMSDNWMRDQEIIFSINYAANSTQTFGGSTFLVCGSVLGGNNTMSAQEFGVTGGWSGNRTTTALMSKFDMTNDQRVAKEQLLFTNNRGDGTITELSDSDQGYGIGKFRNMTSTGHYASNDGKTDRVENNIPVYRVSDVYLMLAELDLRQGKAVSAAHLENLNKIQERAGLSPTLTAGNVTLDWLLDERARELYWEGHRRTDLIRFGKFTGGAYIWPFKGGTAQGASIEAKYKLFPIPSADQVANPNLERNPNY